MYRISFDIIVEYDDSDLIIYREKWLFMSQSAAIHERHRIETPFYTNEKKNF